MVLGRLRSASSPSEGRRACQNQNHIQRSVKPAKAKRCRDVTRKMFQKKVFRFGYRSRDLHEINRYERWKALAGKKIVESMRKTRQNKGMKINEKKTSANAKRLSKQQWVSK